MNTSDFVFLDLPDPFTVMWDSQSSHHPHRSCKQPQGEQLCRGLLLVLTLTMSFSTGIMCARLGSACCCEVGRTLRQLCDQCLEEQMRNCGTDKVRQDRASSAHAQCIFCCFDEFSSLTNYDIQYVGSARKRRTVPICVQKRFKTPPKQTGNDPRVVV